MFSSGSLFKFSDHFQASYFFLNFAFHVYRRYNHKVKDIFCLAYRHGNDNIYRLEKGPVPGLGRGLRGTMKKDGIGG
jgi:hypothetical protein